MRRSGSGFTLIELMIAVAIVALLTTIGLPAYQEHIAKGKRSEGQAALMRAIQLEERNYTANGTYVTDLAPLFGLAAAATVRSGDDPTATTGKYTLTVVTDAANNCTVLTDCVSITATPNAPFVDAKCGNMTLNSRGLRTESGSETLAYCWR